MESERKDEMGEAAERAVVIGLPGEGARAMGVVRSGWPVLCMLFVCGYLLGSALPFPVGPTGLGLALLAAAGGVAALVSLCETRWKRHVKGAAGEIRVARALERLPAGYVIRHGLPMQALRDIDHVVVGPNGVFVVETKNWEGPIEVEGGIWTVGGVEGVRSPVDQVARAGEAFMERIQRELGLSVSVIPLVCLAGARLADGEDGVCTAEAVCSVIFEYKSGSGLESEACERISEWLVAP